MNTAINFQHFSPHQGGNVILLVDSNKETRFCLKESLINNFQIIESENAGDAWKLLLNKLPNVIIADWSTQEDGEHSLCSTLKSDDNINDIPIVITGPSSLEIKIKCLRQGADDYLVMPFFAAELQVKIFNLIESRKRIRKMLSQHVDSQTRSISSTESFLKRAMEIIEVNLNNSQFGIVPFARELGMSQAQLYRKMVGATGTSPNDFIRHFRLNKAAQLLQQNFGNISEVAYKVGFNSLSYFSKCFREKFGCNPLGYLRKTP